MLYNYAKWKARSGLKLEAIQHILLAIAYAPKSKGRVVFRSIRVVLLNYSLLIILKFHMPAANKIVKSLTNGI